jgi:glycosyltransferase involved in cell wall biosynthesis
MISIIIPAHNEESVIARGLRAIVTGAGPGELDVIVACNGCTDRTADIARGFGPPVRMIEIAQASKTAALNAADELATGFPRFYVDADVVLDLASIRAMAAVLERGDALLAAPSLRMDLSKTTWPVRAYYRVWTGLPYNQVMVGTGAYGLSRAGCARFCLFPDLIADDGFVRFCFSPEERVRVDSAYSWVDPPRTLSGLIKIKTRSRLGFYQHRQALRSRPADRKSFAGLLRTFLPRPSLWPWLPLYAGISLFVRLRAARQLRALGATGWERDDSRAATAQY